MGCVCAFFWGGVRRTKGIAPACFWGCSAALGSAGPILSKAMPPQLTGVRETKTNKQAKLTPGPLARHPKTPFLDPSRAVCRSLFSGSDIVTGITSRNISRKLFVVQIFCLLHLVLTPVFNCATWRAPWTSTVCFTKSFEVKIVVQRAAWHHFLTHKSKKITF